MNGCAFCVDTHTRDLRKMGETEQRISLIAVWRDAPQFTPKERVVLELTEAVTRIGDGGVPQSLYERVREHVSEEEYLALVMAINAINCWNRISISTGMFPGCFDAAQQ
jgi:alkylhydroperoxidase family enzyme